MTPVVKERADAPPGFFEAEAAGLAWLAAGGGVRCARVLEVRPGRIVLERVDQVRPDADAARAFGSALAATHASGAHAFGVPPDATDGFVAPEASDGLTGYTGQEFIGSRPMPSAAEATWGAFYARDRVLPFLEIALGAGTVPPRGERIVRAACERVAAGEFDDGEPPSRVHGDLWNGNVLWSPEGVVLIDPAAHGGHRETDLAMLALFGCPFLDEVLAGYESAAPLRAGWRGRVPLHQLHPLAVHAAGHGPSYGRALVDAASAVLAL